MGDNRRGIFLKGALVLTAAGLISKVLGSVYRIPLTWLIGPEGMGLFQMAYPLYLVVLALSTAGLPVAISKLVAERVALKDHEGVRAIHRSAVLLLIGLGLAGSLVMLAGARFLASGLFDSRAYYAIIAFSPAVFLMAVLSAWRGYFQGWQRMTPVAVSQVLEQVVRVGTMLLLAWILIPKGVAHAAAGVAFGGAAGAGAAWAYLLWQHFRQKSGLEGRARKSRQQVYYREIISRIAKLAWPIALGAVLVPLTQALDSTIVPSRLGAAGLSAASATAAMGHLGNAWALVVFPTVLTAALSTSLVPAISDALARRETGIVRARVAESIRYAALIGLPAAAGLWLLSREIARLLFSAAGSGAAVPLQWLAPAAFFLGLQQTTSGALQGLGRPALPVRHFLLGAAVKVGLTILLVPCHGLALRGAALGTVAGAAITSTLNLGSLIHLTGIRLPWGKSLGIPAAGSVAVILTAGLLRRVMARVAIPLLISVPLCIGAAAAVYGAFLWWTGAIGPAETGVMSRIWRKAGRSRRPVKRGSFHE